MNVQSETGLRIDAHHHLWRYSREFDWIGEDMRSLRRDFLIGDLRDEMRTAGVQAAITVQARQSLEETDWLLSLAAAPDSPICGVVGWLPLAEESLPEVLERYRDAAALKGVRHIVQAEASGFLDDAAFNRGVRTLRAGGLVYEILVYARQMEETIRFVDRHPDQPFVLDHLGKPDIRNGGLEEWRPLLHRMAERPNVACKLSGLVTEADFDGWTEATLRPYLDVALAAFEPERLMVGSDWPVLTVACSYGHWWRVVETWMAELTTAEQSQMLGRTAARWYGLKVPAAKQEG